MTRINKVRKAIKYITGKEVTGDFKTIGQMLDGFNKDCEKNGLKIPVDQMPDGYPYINTEYKYRLEEQSYTTKNSYAARAAKEFTIPWFSHAEGEKIIVKYDGKEFELKIESYDNDYNGIGDPALVIYQYEYSNEIPFYIKLRKTSVESNAVVYVYTGEESHSLAVYTKSAIPVPLDEKFIPPLSSLTLKSSTEGSLKQFKVTVDDSGTLSATEITG